MKLEINRKEFIKSWKQLESCSSRIKEAHGIKVNASLEVSCEAINNSVALKIKNMKGVTVQESGQAVIPSGLLLNLILKASEDVLQLEISNGKGVLKSGKNKTRFATKPLENFPKLPEMENAKNLAEISSSELIKFVLQGSSAAGSPVEFPKYIGAVMLKLDEGKIICTSTDGKRLAIAESEMSGLEAVAEEYIVPAPELKGIVTEAEGDTVKILADDAMVYFDFGAMVYSVRRIDINFPQYQRLINDEVASKIKINAPTLLSALERIDIVARANPAKIISMSIDSELKIGARVAEVGTAVERLACEFEGEKLMLGCNINFLREGLKLFKEAEIEFSGEEKQFRIYENGKRDFMYLLMPARLTEQDKVVEDEE